MQDVSSALPPPRSIREWSGVDARIFNEEIVPAYRPAVMRGLLRDWPVVCAARQPDDTTDQNGDGIAAYLDRFDQGRPIETFIGDPSLRGRFFYRDDLRGMNFDRRKVPLGATLRELIRVRSLANPPALYAGAASAPDYLPGFEAENVMPLLPPTVTPRVWIGNAVTIATHYDLSANIACVAAGRRRFTLFPPDQVSNLYVGPLEHTIAGQPVSMVDIDAPDLERFPRFRSALAHALTAELEPGDALYVPALWWHQVQSFGALNLLVNYWWGQATDGSPFECLIHGLLTIRDLPSQERAAWRAVFDHYVFGEEAGSAGKHLPVEGQGILGPASEARSKLIRQFLLGSLARG